MTILNILLIIASSLLFLVGIIGCIIPGLPGTPLCWAGLLLGYFNTKCNITLTVLIVAAVVCVAVEIINNIVPSFFTKKSGGTKAGSIGSIIGVFAGMLSGQIILIIAGPFLGALIGELINDSSNFKKALKSACYSFLGFITGTGMRLVTACIILVIFIRAFF